MLSTATSPVRSHVPNAHERHVVLIVDDYVETLDAEAAFLESTGAKVFTAESGREALALLRAGLRPCVMLLDVRMPDLDGWEVWDLMRQDRELAGITVVILSADPVDEARTRDVGIREFLRKPIGGRRLVGAVERHCEQSAKMYSALES